MHKKLESSYEGYFVRKAASCGFLPLKLVAMSRRGFPDRTCLGKGAHIFFVELKRDGNEKPKKHQLYWHRLLRKLGFRVYVAYDKETIDEAFNIERKMARS